MKRLRLSSAALLALALIASVFDGLVGPLRAADTEAGTRQYAAAAALQTREQYDLAADEWEKFVQDYPEDARKAHARHYLGFCQLKTGKFPAAVQTLEPLIAAAPAELAEATYLFLGLAHYNAAGGKDAAQLQKAREILGELARKYPQGQHAVQALYYRAEADYALGQKAEAAKAYKQLLEIAPQDPLAPDALYALGVAQLELKDFKAAEASYDRFLQQFATNPLAGEVTLRRGESLAGQNKLSAAREAFTAAAGREEFALADHATVRAADCALAEKKYAEAAALYSGVPARFPKSAYVAKARLAAGKSYQLAGQFDQARPVLEPLLKADGAEGLPLAREAAHWLARGYLRQHDGTKALAAVAPFVKQPVDDEWQAALELDRADALYETPNRRADALTAYASVADARPNDPAAPQAAYLAAFTALELGQASQAQKLAETFLQRWPKHDLAADVKYIAAESKLQRKDWAGAAELFGELSKDHSGHRDARMWQVRRGLAHYLGGQYAEAVKALDKLAGKLQPESLAAEAWFLIGASQNELGDFSAGAEALQKSLQADSKWRQADEARLALATALKASGRTDAAIAQLQTILAEFQQSPIIERASYRLGEYLEAAGRQAEAQAAYHRVVDQWPKGSLAPAALYGLAWTEFRAGKPEAAAKAFDQIIQDHPQSEAAQRARYARAVAYRELKQYDAAVKDLDAFLASNPPRTQRSDALYVLGLCQAGLGQPELAVKTLRGLLKDDPDYASADKVLSELAWTLRAAGKQAESAAEFQRLSKQFPKSPLAGESSYLAGEALYETGKYSDAARAYYAAIGPTEGTPLAESVFHKLGWSYYHQEKYPDAQATFASQRETFPKGALAVEAAFMEGECRFKQRQFKEALAAYAQVKNPGRPEVATLALLHGAQAAAQLGDFAGSRERLDRAIKEQPDSPHLGELLCELGWAQQNLGEEDAALVSYEAATAKTDGEAAARARFLVGEIHFARKNHREAVKNFFKAAAGYAYPQWQAAAHYESGRCFEVLGQKDQARKSYQEVVDHFSSSDQAPLARERLKAL